MPEWFKLTNPIQLYYGHRMHRYVWVSTPPPFKFDDKTRTKNQNGLFVHLLKYARVLVVKFKISIVIYYEIDMPPLISPDIDDSMITFVPATRLRVASYASTAATTATGGQRRRELRA